MRRQSLTQNAILANKVLSGCAAGKNLFQICEELAPEFDHHVWAAYDAIYPIYNSEKAKIHYAKTYLIKVLHEYGFKKKEIAKISGLTQQRCGQIINHILE